MSKTKSEILDESKEVVFDNKNGCVRFEGYKLYRPSLRAFFGLAQLGKMLRIGLDKDGKTTVIQTVSEGIENFYTEVERLVTKYSDDPEKGFREVERIVKFAKEIKAREEKPNLI